jgi:hypothetical protein
MTRAEAQRIGRALDALALALTDNGHCWSAELRGQYEEAVETIRAYGGCMEPDSSASEKSLPDAPSTEHPLRVAQA